MRRVTGGVEFYLESRTMLPGPEFYPIAWLSVCLCLFAVSWCMLLIPKLRYGPDRFLVGLLGLLTVHHGSQMLRDAGFWLGPNNPGWSAVAGLAITGLYLVVLVVVEVRMRENRAVAYRLRLAEANEPPPPPPYVPAAGDHQRNQAISYAVIESSPLPMYAVDPAGSICYWNAAAERVFGYRREEVLGRTIPELVGAQVEEHARSFRRKDGSKITAEVWTAPIEVDALRGTLTSVSGTPAEEEK